MRNKNNKHWQKFVFIFLKTCVSIINRKQARIQKKQTNRIKTPLSKISISVWGSRWATISHTWNIKISFSTIWMLTITKKFKQQQKYPMNERNIIEKCTNNSKWPHIWFLAVFSVANQLRSHSTNRTNVWFGLE
jgi:hypothetical protein